MDDFVSSSVDRNASKDLVIDCETAGAQGGQPQKNASEHRNLNRFDESEINTPQFFSISSRVDAVIEIKLQDLFSFIFNSNFCLIKSIN